ncbi:MAG: MgtC/SapB family protein [Candidatus Pacebacteria bacterium]|nr:MgtC/SapB family protein [Candidatus Paceibacterota bacterium]MCF7857190.1 MgtC/SapB family protein [Candidatus Paceibacterota bacterium]
MIASIFSQTELTFFFNLLLCLLAGLAIGIEREARGKDAGISTHTLVIMGSMLFTYISLQVEPDHSSRIAAQIVTGIGFLGAGLILKKGTVVHNLTTAASLWFAAAIGMAFGFGFYMIGFFATVVAIITLHIPRLVHGESHVSPKQKVKVQ